MNRMIRWAAALLALATTTSLVAQRTPDEALRALQEGNRRFAADKSIAQPLGEGVRRTLARGQSPFAIVLCCADSRVPPELIFNAGLGELFVVRVAGHTCDPETLASIEYAVDHLNTSLCVVLGHESCGAVAATVAQIEAQQHEHPEPAESQALQQLLEQIEPAVRKVQVRDLGGKDLTDAAEEEHAQLTATECLRRSPLLRRFAQVGKFKMVAARYHLQSGEVEWLPNRPLPVEPGAKPSLAHGTVPMGVPPHVALRMLQAGHRRFLGDGAQAGDLTAGRREQLTHGQHPLAIVLTCADSRVAPEHVFDAGLGELFVIRVAGNTINDDVLASIEYAAAHTGASLLVVMGHTRCGAVTAAAGHPEGQQLSSAMRALLARIEPSVEKVRPSGATGSDLVELAVRTNVQRAVAEARSRSAILRQLEDEGRFAMLPTVYDIATGDLEWLKDTSDHTEAAPPAAPTGETSHGAKAEEHGGADSAHGEASHEVDPHKKPEHDAVPAKVLDWADEDAMPVAPTHGTKQQPATGHGASARDTHVAHGSETGNHAATGAEGQPAADEHGAHEEHGATDEHGEAAAQETGEEHGEHGAHAEATANTATQSAWSDPIVLVGISGVASLLLAALVAVMKK
jgi:carbonic anhydrase